MLPFVQASSASMLLNRCKLNWVSYYRCFPLESFAKPLEHPGKTLGTSLEAETHQACVCLPFPVSQTLSTTPLFALPCYDLLLSLVFYSLYQWPNYLL